MMQNNQWGRSSSGGGVAKKLIQTLFSLSISSHVSSRREVSATTAAVDRESSDRKSSVVGTIGTASLKPTVAVFVVFLIK